VFQINDMSNWAVTNMNNPTVQKKGNTIEVKVESADVINSGDPIYWIAPTPYRGNKVRTLLPSYQCSANSHSAIAHCVE